MVERCLPLATAPVDSRPHLAVLGVISSPANEGRRNWARKFQALRPDLVLRFVIGAIGLPAQQCRRLIREERAHGGLFLVASADNAEVGCVDKSFAWFMAAVEAFPAAKFIIKTDDDSATNMADLAALLSLRALQANPHVYAGWAQFASAIPATWQQCGWGVSPPSAFKRRHSCASGAEGPFVFAAGALEILSAELARRVFRSRWVDVASPALTQAQPEHEPGKSCPCPGGHSSSCARRATLPSTAAHARRRGGRATQKMLWWALPSTRPRRRIYRTAAFSTGLRPLTACTAAQY